MKASSVKITEEIMGDLWLKYGSDAGLSDDEFKNHCVDVISAARAPNHEIIRKLPAMSRDKALQAATNFVFKGHGYGVL
jgi:hypothetical protein